MVSYHNVYFYVKLMEKIRQAIAEERYAEFQKTLKTVKDSIEKTEDDVYKTTDNKVEERDIKKEGDKIGGNAGNKEKTA